jgi:threonine/homoserine/homoserine lactone efflux protein
VDALPIEPTALAPFLVAVLFIELTPGPNMGYLAALSASQGRAAGFKAVLGVTAGLALYMLLAVLGVAEIIAAAPACVRRAALGGRALLAVPRLGGLARRARDVARARTRRGSRAVLARFDGQRAQSQSARILRGALARVHRHRSCAGLGAGSYPRLTASGDQLLGA